MGMMMGNQGLKEMLKVRAELALVSKTFTKVFTIALLAIAKAIVAFILTFQEISKELKSYDNFEFITLFLLKL